VEPLPLRRFARIAWLAAVQTRRCSVIRYSLAIAAQIVEAVTGKTYWDREGLGEAECAGRVDVP
jgi:hypothetical protein